jgi:urease accessory protein
VSEHALYRLLSWLSPAYPIGSFAHSSGLEWAIDEGFVTSRPELEKWIGELLTIGSTHNDAILFVHAFRIGAARDQKSFAELVELAAALNPSRERWLEATAQGAAFYRIASTAAHCDGFEHLTGGAGDSLSYAIAVAALAQSHEIPLQAALTAYVHAVVANLVSAAQRLIPLGQTDGQIAIAALEPAVHHLVSHAITFSGGDPFEQLGSATLLADFATLAHETQYTRLFRT